MRRLLNFAAAFGTRSMTDRKQRKGWRTTEDLAAGASRLEDLADEFRVIIASMKREKFAAIEVDGISKIDRAIESARQYLAKVDAALTLAKRLRK